MTKLKWIVEPDYDALSRTAANILLDQVAHKPNSRLGLPTGSTPARMYSMAVEICSAGNPCFSAVETWNLDEYVGIPKDHPSSYRTYMRERLFSHINIDLDRTHLPSGDPEVLAARFGERPFEEALELECKRYESLIRSEPLDLTILGVGRNGHIGFNEPGTPFASRTHVITLDESTRKANAPWFLDRAVPAQAITMGLDTIMTSRRVVLLASGPRKRAIIERLAAEPPSIDIPASILGTHPDATIIVDRQASAESVA